jgi:uncharacterized membrane protein YqjE
MNGEAPSEMPIGKLVSEISAQVSLLAKKEIELAKTELRSDLKGELAMIKGLGVAAVAVFMAAAMLVVALVLALAGAMPGWAAALLVCGVLLAVAAGAAAFGWQKRVKTPLERTRSTLKEAFRWTKRRTA